MQASGGPRAMLLTSGSFLLLLWYYTVVEVSCQGKSASLFTVTEEAV